MGSAGFPAPGCAAVIPVFVPDARLSRIAKAVAATLPRLVVVVDDGSSARSAIHFHEPQGLERVAVPHHGSNRGKGEAIKPGLRHVIEHCPDAVGAVSMDADGQHTLENFLKVGALLLREKHALVLGERAFDARAPTLSRMGNVPTKAIFNRAHARPRLEDARDLEAAGGVARQVRAGFAEAPEVDDAREPRALRGGEEVGLRAPVARSPHLPRNGTRSRV